jgi:hypothetical protein
MAVETLDLRKIADIEIVAVQNPNRIVGIMNRDNTIVGVLAMLQLCGPTYGESKGEAIIANLMFRVRIAI